MRYALGALVLTLVSHSLVLAQNCPTGYNRTIKWYDCPTEAEDALQCAILTVPLDYQDPSSSSIPLPLVRVPATSSNPKGQQSIIYNPGGPGGSGISAFASGQGTAFQKIFGSQFNFISFDPRGVALSTIFEGGLDNYDCPSSDDVTTGPYETDPQLNAAVGNFTLQASLCAQKPWGTDGQYVGTPANARDIVAIAQALAGEDGYVRYYGASYGTLLGSTLVAMFPDKMDRIILDGNINPTDYYYGDGSEAAADIDAALTQFFYQCAAAPSLCALADKNQTGAQLLQEYNDIFNDSKKRAVATGNYKTEFFLKNQVVGGVKFAGPTFINYANLLAEFYSEYRQYYNTSTSQKRQEPTFDPTDATTAESDQEGSEVLYAVTCGDYKGPRVATLDSFRKLRDAYNARSAYAGDSNGLLSIILQCSTWQTKNKDQFNASLTNVKTRNPVLFVNGIYDPVTPHISAQNASAGFVGSGVLLHNGAGHCSSSEPIAALNAAMAQYWKDGKIPAQRTYNKTTNSFAVGQQVDLPDPNVNSTSNSTVPKVSHTDLTLFTSTNALDLKDAYPNELLDMLHAHLNTVQKRATNTSSSVPAGCTAVGPGIYVGAADRVTVTASAIVIAIAAAFLL